VVSWYAAAAARLTCGAGAWSKSARSRWCRGKLQHTRAHARTCAHTYIQRARARVEWRVEWWARGGWGVRCCEGLAGCRRWSSVPTGACTCEHEAACCGSLVMQRLHQLQRAGGHEGGAVRRLPRSAGDGRDQRPERVQRPLALRRRLQTAVRKWQHGRVLCVVFVSKRMDSQALSSQACRARGRHCLALVVLSDVDN
jgi:hypothetical protein